MLIYKCQNRRLSRKIDKFIFEFIDRNKVTNYFREEKKVILYLIYLLYFFVEKMKEKEIEIENFFYF